MPCAWGSQGERETERQSSENVSVCVSDLEVLRYQSLLNSDSSRYRGHQNPPQKNPNTMFTIFSLAYYGATCKDGNIIRSAGSLINENIREVKHLT